MKMYGIQHKKSKKLLTLHCSGDGNPDMNGTLAELTKYDSGVIWLTPDIDSANKVLDFDRSSTFFGSDSDNPYINPALAVGCKVVEIDLTVVGQ